MVGDLVLFPLASTPKLTSPPLGMPDREMITEVDALHAEPAPSKQASRQGEPRRSRTSASRKASSREFDNGETRAELYPVEFDVRRVDPAATKVVRRLTRSGFEAYLVG